MSLTQPSPGRAEPSAFVRRAMGPMTRVLNPLVLRLAGRRHFPSTAQIHHRGRRSGRSYTTPAGARPVGDSILIPLTFGTESDWVRNVRAADGCRITWRAADYEATDPRILAGRDIRPLLRTAFHPHERVMFKALGITHFMHLRTGTTTPERPEVSRIGG